MNDNAWHARGFDPHAQPAPAQDPLQDEASGPLTSDDEDAVANQLEEIFENLAAPDEQR